MTAAARPAARTAARTAGASALLAGLLGLVATAGAAPAGAHNVVVDSSPADGATVTAAPDTVDITFDDVVLNVSADGTSTVVTVTDEAGDEHATGCPTTQDRTVSVPVSLDEPGEYTVGWRIVSADGHPTSGELAFTYAPDPAAAADSGTGTGAQESAPGDEGADADGAVGCGAGDGDGGGAAAAAGTSDAQDASTAARSGGSSELPLVLGIAGGVVVLGGATVLVALRVVRRRD